MVRTGGGRVKSGRDGARHVDGQQQDSGLERDGAVSAPGASPPIDLGTESASGLGHVSRPPQPTSAVRTPAHRMLDRALDRYPKLPLAPRSRLARIALGVVILMAAAFAAFFIADAVLLHAAYQTHAEDLGIMDQALWNTTNSHGQLLHQTICDTIGDTNCLGDIPRTAIHFEPILFLVALFYAAVPSPLTPVVIQALVVASGALPAYWIASRRLGSALAGVVFAALYLAFPALQAPVVGDFHAVTLSAAIILFALYFMLSRNNWGLWIACLLAMTTKEEIPLLVVMIGLSVAVLQRRWRLGLALAGVAVAYLGLALLIIHLSSPIGHSSTASRYAYLGISPLQAAKFVLKHPVQIVKQYLLGPGRITYLRKLLAPAGYLALLSPLTLLIAVPELAINMLSSDPLMYSGGGQYNAAIVPVIVVASIESVALLGGVAAWIASQVPADLREQVRARLARALRTLPAAVSRQLSHPLPRIVMAGAVLLAFGLGVYEQRDRGLTPLTWGFHWPSVTTHDTLANTIVKMIPVAASVSAQSDLVPHVSQRRHIYLFPDHADTADYVFLDVTGNIFPLQDTPDAYVSRVQALLAGGAYHVAAAQDGYLLLARGPGASTQPAADTYRLPATFYSFAEASRSPQHALRARYGPSLELVGYDVLPASDTNLNVTRLNVTTYWRVTGPVPAGLVPQVVLLPPGGQLETVTDLPTTEWLPADRWPASATIVVASRSLTPVTGAGMLQFGVRILAPTDSGSSVPLPATMDAPRGSGQAYPQVDAASGAIIFAGERVIP
jgi:uncharacterized membrane protein